MVARRIQAFSGGTVIPLRQYCTSYSLTPSHFAARAELMPARFSAPLKRAAKARLRRSFPALRSR